MSTYRITSISDLKFLKNNAGSVQKVDVHFGNEADFKNKIKTLTYEGDAQEADVYFQTGFNVDITADSYDIDALATIFSKTAVTAGLPVDEAKRWYWGALADSGGVTCGIEATMTLEDIDTGANKQARVVAPVGKLSAPMPPSLKNIAKAPLKCQFSAVKTTADIAGVALPSVPTDGCFWYLAELV